MLLLPRMRDKNFVAIITFPLLFVIIVSRYEKRVINIRALLLIGVKFVCQQHLRGSPLTSFYRVFIVFFFLTYNIMQQKRRETERRRGFFIIKNERKHATRLRVLYPNQTRWRAYSFVIRPGCYYNF